MSFTNPALYNYENPVHVYEWKAWSGYLFRSICPNAIRIEAKIRQPTADIVKKLKVTSGYFLFHLNLTKTAFFYKDKEGLITELMSRGITPLNAGVRDISKQHLQNVCEQVGLNSARANQEGEANELLITKTNFNHGGKSEKRLMRSQFRRLNLSADEYDHNIIYPVMERKKIQPEVWDNKNLVVEKYISNKNNYIFRVYVLLDKMVISQVVNPAIIKKMVDVDTRTNYYYDLGNPDSISADSLKYNDIVVDITRLCTALHVDFAALDVVKSDDGKYYIIDLNVTPNWGVIDDFPEITSFLAAGLAKKQVTAAAAPV